MKSFIAIDLRHVNTSSRTSLTFLWTALQDPRRPEWHYLEQNILSLRKVLATGRESTLNATS